MRNLIDVVAKLKKQDVKIDIIVKAPTGSAKPFFTKSIKELFESMGFDTAMSDEAYSFECKKELREKNHIIIYEETPLTESALLESTPRELTLEEIAVAAMSGLLASRDHDRLIDVKSFVYTAYDIAEAMKAEKQRREKKSEERNG